MIFSNVLQHIKTRKFFPFLILFLAACSAPESEGIGYSQYRVVKVIDGDTIKLSNGKLLRYIGIDTPECRIRRQNTWIYDPKPFAREAAELNTRLVDGKIVRIEFDRERCDKYNRLLGYAFVDNTFINSKLIEEGFAIAYSYPPNVKYAENLINAQKQAQHQKKGMWGNLEIIDSVQANNYLDQIRTVKGMIMGIRRSPKVIVLNMGSNKSPEFTIVIFAKSFSYFENKKINPVTYYRGKTVQITGRIRSYRGIPQIIAGMPEDIEITR